MQIICLFFSYKRGQNISLEVLLTASHDGHFEFSICKLNSTKDIETDECFDANPILLNEKSYKYDLDKNLTGSNMIELFGHLPKNLVCEHCVLRWHYRSGNNWNECSDGEDGKKGCGDQEIFRGCSDIAIEDETEDENQTTEENEINKNDDGDKNEEDSKENEIKNYEEDDSVEDYPVISDTSEDISKEEINNEIEDVVAYNPILPKMIANYKLGIEKK